MRIVGIIGPYFGGGNRRLIDHNIANAQYVMICIANHFAKSKLVGFFAPHSHTARFERLAEAPENYYHELDDALYDRACEASVMLPGWETSTGAFRDYNRAVHQKKPFFYLTDYSDKSIGVLLELLQQWALS